MGRRRAPQGRACDPSFPQGLEAKTNVSLVEVEADFNVDFDGHWLAVFVPRIKAPLAHGLNRLFVQPHAERTLHSDIVSLAVGADDHAQNDISLPLVLAGLFAELRLDPVEDFGALTPPPTW